MKILARYSMGQGESSSLRAKMSDCKLNDLSQPVDGQKFRPPYSRRPNAITVNSQIALATTFFIYFLICDMSKFERVLQLVGATSINYGISQQPVTDINQLMPKLCQNQSTICEGSYCIPGVRKCVCDLRMPVQFGRFCLKQVDIETKCFVTNQCNHTIKDAVCIDINSNAILDTDSSKFKLDQWQQLNELRQMSQSVGQKEVPKQTNSMTESSQRRFFLLDNELDNRFTFQDTRFVVSNARNSPYEINYDTQELMVQNHTRRRTNNSDRMQFYPFPSSNTNFNKDPQASDGAPSATTVPEVNSRTSTIETTAATAETRFKVANDTSQTTARSVPVEVPVSTTSTGLNSVDNNIKTEVPSGRTGSLKEQTNLYATTTVSYTEANSKKKMVIKNPHWPPGICSCPFGFMFDSMLRKCLALSLADSHCQTDSDCKQIAMTHCSLDSRKCLCDEPLVWDQRELACVMPRPTSTTVSPVPKEINGFVDNLLPPLVLSKLLPDYTILLLIFIVLVIIATLIILKLTVKCFSSSSSALISPKNRRKKPSAANNLPPRSPYATLRRPDHKPSSQLSNFTQATRGRILNYDFEQEGDEGESGQFDVSTLPSKSNSKVTRHKNEKFNTMKANKSHKHQRYPSEDSPDTAASAAIAKALTSDDQSLELNDNISISQLESNESKSENSILTIPAPPPTQQPPYMMTSAMKGQGSAIAAAAAAVANKRMQMAQKKNLEQQSSSKSNGLTPVFL